MRLTRVTRFKLLLHGLHLERLFLHLVPQFPQCFQVLAGGCLDGSTESLFLESLVPGIRVRRLPLAAWQSFASDAAFAERELEPHFDRSAD